MRIISNQKGGIERGVEDTDRARIMGDALLVSSLGGANRGVDTSAVFYRSAVDYDPAKDAEIQRRARNQAVALIGRR